MIDLLAFQQSRSQAKQVEQEARLNNLQADVEITAAEADRKRALADAIATSRASAAGRGGSAFEGSPLTAVREMSRRSNIEGQRNRYSSRVGQLAEDYRAKVKSGQIKQQANISLLRSLEAKAAGMPTSAPSGGSATESPGEGVLR